MSSRLGLRVVFAGINPGLYSAATGYHFARPGNRFWLALHRSGFTGRVLRPDEQEQLLGLGLGITNIVARATARADELRPEEFRRGRASHTERKDRPTAATLARGRRGDRLPGGVRPPARGGGPAGRGHQGDPAMGAPNPSGPNAHWAQTPSGQSSPGCAPRRG